ncbi:MAG: sensor histidine kinase [Anaerolineales bacterium]
MGQFATWLQDNHDALREAILPHMRTSQHLRKNAHAMTELLLESLQSISRGQLDLATDEILTAWFENRQSDLPADAAYIGLALDIQATIRHEVYNQLGEPIPGEDALIILQECADVFDNLLRAIAEREAQAQHVYVDTTLTNAQQDHKRLEKHKADFISVASHELKTPLTLIEGYANMLNGTLADAEVTGASKTVQGILNGIQRLREIIEDMIDMASIELELLEINPQPVWLPRLLNIVVSEQNRLAESRNIQIALDAASLPKEAIPGDPERLYQVFVNIIENGIKYTPDGGTIHIWGTLDEQARMITLAFQDSGIGLAKEDQRVVFEKFFSLGQIGLHSSSKIKFKGGGPGLGLAIARGIVEAHQGRIWVESPGHDEKDLPGSCFYVQLPLAHPGEFQRTDSDAAWMQHPAIISPESFQNIEQLERQDKAFRK